LSRPYPPIADYALIGDCHSVALVSRDGEIDWCCFHRFDSRPVFSRLIDWSRGGYFSVAPVEPYRALRRYLPGTNILETRFETSSGVFLLTDCFPIREAPTSDDADPVHPYHQLVRIGRCERGEVTVHLEFSPRFDYGLTVPEVRPVSDRLVTVIGGADALLLQSDLPITQTDISACEGKRALQAGEVTRTVLTYALPHELRPRVVMADELDARLASTRDFWTSWSNRCTYEGPYRDRVVRSALVLKALTNSPTGAIVAAPTTSLPENIGGTRNWDYRYAWLRDSAFTLYALFILGYTDEATAFMQWIKRTTAGRPEDLQAVYGVGGERLLPEVELRGLDGYRGSRPVRIGNGASTQFQLDIYGEVIDTAWLYHRHGGVIETDFWDFLVRLGEQVAKVWIEPDEGIWEVRGGRRHFVYSKVMAWVAIDRLIRLGRALQRPLDVDRWLGLRDEIRRRVETEGVDPVSGAFVQSLGSTSLDASALLLPLVHFLPADDPRMHATIERVEKELSVEGFVYRYLDGTDGLPGGEATFLICSFWLVDNLALTGQVKRARELFERLCECANDLGLLGEEVDPRTGELLGNFPQAFSHIGLINSAIQLARQSRSRASMTKGTADWEP
jgi:GH15 family glucan-1,4-alpha-glucosidase